MKVRVLIVGNFLSSRGLPRGVCEELADRLSTAGWTVLRTSARHGRLARLLDIIVTVWRERHSYDVAQVDVYSGKAFLWAELACWGLRRVRKPYILTLHGGSLPAFSRRWPFRVRRLLGSANLVTSPSAFLRDSLKEMREDIVILPNALEVSRYPFVLRSNPRPLLVWLRAFHHIYNPSLAPRVLSILADECRGARLLMIGPDKSDGSREATHSIASELGVLDQIVFAGGITKEDVPLFLAKGDIFLNTSNVDNTPVTVLEAMACGMCVVSTDVGGLPFLVQNGRNAILVRPNDATEMANAVRRVLNERDLSESLSRNARKMTETLDWAVVLPKWETLLRGLARTTSKPVPRTRSSEGEHHGAP